MSRIGFVLARIAIIAALLALWEMLPRIGAVDPRLLPPLSDVIASLVDILGRPAVKYDLLTTLTEIVVAFAIAVPAGAMIGLLVAENDYAGRVFKPLFFFVLSMPKSIFLPLMILSIGIGFWQKVAYGVVSTIFILIMGATAAVETVRADHLLVARACGAGRGQIIARIYVPSMLPILLETVRIAMIFNFTGVILAEMYASRTGIGHLIANWGENFMMRQLLGSVLLVAATAIVFNEIIRWLETRCSAWRI
jgi:ABC-type nitrate/sulfonate/bicarbonate transport system permease component